MKKITFCIFFAQLITSPLSPLPNGSIPSTSIATLDSQEVDLGTEAPKASWWEGLSNTQKALIVGSGIIGTTSLLAWGMKKQGYSLFEKGSGEESGKGTLSEKDSQTTTQSETSPKIDKAEEERMRHMALPKVDFLIDNETRSKHGLTRLNLTDFEFRAANSKFYLLLPLDNKIHCESTSPESITKRLQSDKSLSEQLAQFSNKLLLCDFSNSSLIPVDLIEVPIELASHDRDVVRVLGNHPLLRLRNEEELGAYYNIERSYQYFRLEGHAFSQACIKWNNYYILIPQNFKE